jgi:octopine/nopaline transport system permease protein
MSIFEIFGFGPKGWGALLAFAALLTLAVTLASLALGSVFGALVAWAKLSKNIVARILGEAYTTVFRGVPELLVIYFIYFGGSTLVTKIGTMLGVEGFLGLPSFLAGALAVGIISGAYQAEVYRGAFLSVAKGEIEAARAIGMPRMLRFRRIIVPQIMRFALPGLGNVWQLSLKDSALISVTGLAELMRTTQVGAGSTHQYFIFYVAGGAIYLLLTSFSTRIFDAAEARVGKSFRRGIGRA